MLHLKARFKTNDLKFKKYMPNSKFLNAVRYINNKRRIIKYNTLMFKIEQSKNWAFKK